MTSIGASSILYAALAGGLGLLFVAYLVQYVLKKDPGSARIQELSGAIHEGAMAFLRRGAGSFKQLKAPTRGPGGVYVGRGLF